MLLDKHEENIYKNGANKTAQVIKRRVEVLEGKCKKFYNKSGIVI